MKMTELYIAGTLVIDNMSLRCSLIMEFNYDVGQT